MIASATTRADVQMRVAEAGMSGSFLVEVHASTLGPRRRWGIVGRVCPGSYLAPISSPTSV